MEDDDGTHRTGLRILGMHGVSCSSSVMKALMREGGETGPGWARYLNVHVLHRSEG